MGGWTKNLVSYIFRLNAPCSSSRSVDCRRARRPVLRISFRASKKKTSLGLRLRVKPEASRLLRSDGRKEVTVRSVQLQNLTLAVATLLLLVASAAAQAMRGGGIMAPPASQRPPGLDNVGIEQHLNEQIPSELAFRDETGQTVRLRDYFGKKPIILNLSYFNCQMLCPEVLSGLTVALRGLKFDAGREFEILTVSFDPRETPEMAAEKKLQYLARYGRKGVQQGWHFLTGQQDAIAALTKAVGFP